MKNLFILATIGVLLTSCDNNSPANNVGTVPTPPQPASAPESAVVNTATVDSQSLIEIGITKVLPSLKTSLTDYQSAVSFGYTYDNQYMSRVDSQCFDSEYELIKFRGLWEQSASQQFPSQYPMPIGYPAGSVLIVSTDTYAGDPRLSSVYIPLQHGSSYCAITMEKVAHEINLEDENEVNSLHDICEKLTGQTCHQDLWSLALVVNNTVWNDELNYISDKIKTINLNS